MSVWVALVGMLLIWRTMLPLRGLIEEYFGWVQLATCIRLLRLGTNGG